MRFERQFFVVNKLAHVGASSLGSSRRSKRLLLAELGLGDADSSWGLEIVE